MTTSLNDIIGRGSTASRPAAGVPGRLYFDTTAKRLYRDSGIAWVEVALSDSDAVAVASPAVGQTAVWNGTMWVPQTITTTINLVFDGGGYPVLAGIKGTYQFPWSGSIVSATLTSTETGSIEIDLWLKAYAVDSPPTVANSIVGGNYPTLSSQSLRTVSLTGWTTGFTAGDMLRSKVNSASILTSATLALTVSRSA